MHKVQDFGYRYAFYYHGLVQTTLSFVMMQSSSLVGCVEWKVLCITCDFLYFCSFFVDIHFFLVHIMYVSDSSKELVCLKIVESIDQIIL